MVEGSSIEQLEEYENEGGSVLMHTDDAGIDRRVNGIRASDMQVGGDHYAQMPIQPSEFIEKNELGWCEGNAVKYICRHKMKGEKVDIIKAIHYLELILEWEYGNVEDTNSGR